MFPIIKECERVGLDFFILHTGQHYSYNMDRIFFEQLALPEPEYNLDVGSGSHGVQTGRMLENESKGGGKGKHTEAVNIVQEVLDIKHDAASPKEYSGKMSKDVRDMVREYARLKT